MAAAPVPRTFSPACSALRSSVCTMKAAEVCSVSLMTSTPMLLLLLLLLLLHALDTEGSAPGPARLNSSRSEADCICMVGNWPLLQHQMCECAQFLCPMCGQVWGVRWVYAQIATLPHSLQLQTRSPSDTIAREQQLSQRGPSFCV